MEIGQSFVVNSVSHRDTILKYGRTTGKTQTAIVSDIMKFSLTKDSKYSVNKIHQINDKSGYFEFIFRHYAMTI